MEKKVDKAIMFLKSCPEWVGSEHCRNLIRYVQSLEALINKKDEEIRKARFHVGKDLTKMVRHMDQALDLTKEGMEKGEWRDGTMALSGSPRN